MRVRMIVTAVALAAATGLPTLAGSPAAAAEAARDCVVNLDDKTVTCAATEAEARRAAAVPAASLTIARLYDLPNYKGASHTFVQSRACTPSYDTEWQWDDLRNTSGGNWSNRASSVHTYNSCDVRLYDGVDFAGAVSTWIDQSANLAAVGSGWSNRASSIKFS
ncbi:hypothetical protein OG792_12135 [Micromonospora sp. NBC_01699]|uniref:hypothetical protein n=1 Tax=Micromonospora sp. NBC_01699 TaxID=2975984 RepID=UPI002E33EC8A|nr:hypothetical protein [Micromonospora sp. NBC_01699]